MRGSRCSSAALERHPQHPSIEYDRAVILEQAGHVHESVDALEHCWRSGPTIRLC